MRAFAVKTGKRRSRGQSLAEAAIVLPVLFLLLFGTLEFGRVLSIQQTLDDAAREGARWSAMPAAGTSVLPSPNDIVTRVQNYLASNGISAGSATINVNQTDDISEGGIDTFFSRVDVSVPYDFLTPMLSAIVPSVTLTSHSVMRNEIN